MAAQILGSVILWLIAAAVVITIGVYLLRWLYRRSTKETAFVRTGFGGEKVVINGGAFVIPVLHEMTPVSMNTMRVEVRRGQQSALITHDRMRVDLIAEFFLRVKPSPDAVAIAAQTLGLRIRDQEGIRELFEGKFASSLRAVAAEMSLEEIHEQRGRFMARVRELAGEALAYNGLELEHVSLVDVDQTSLEYFDPSNAFDAEGLTLLTQSIETRRKMRNQIEQQTMIEIRNQNLDAERRVLEIDRESEYARIEQEREIEIRRAQQRADLARERALSDQESRQAELASTEATERSRIAQERVIAESRIAAEQDISQREIARRVSVESSELQSRERLDREQITLELAIERERIARQQERERLEVARRQALDLAEREREIALSHKAIEVIQADIEAKRAEIDSRSTVEAARIAAERKVEESRIERERALQALEIARRQAFEEAEISAGDEVERARIATERGLDEARVGRTRDLRKLEIERERVVEVAEIDRAISVAAKVKERSVAIADAETARGLAIAAEEKTFTIREREIAERRKLIDLVAAARDAETIVMRAEATALRYRIEAEGQRQANEAENILSPESRAARARMKLLDKLEGIVRESVKPMEKIEGINILHVDGLGGQEGGRRNVTDEVIDSALRYRVQAPMIDSLMKEVGIEGGSIGRMTDVLRDAKDIDQLTRNRQKAEGAKPDRDDDR